MYPRGTIYIIDPQIRREEIEKHRLEKSSKKTSISSFISSFKINAIADVCLGKALRIFWHGTFITAAVQHDIVIHRESSQAPADVDTNWKIQRTMETIKKLHFNIQNSVLRKKDSCRTAVGWNSSESSLCGKEPRGNSGRHHVLSSETKCIEHNNPPGGLSVISRSQKTAKGYGN